MLFIWNYRGLVISSVPTTNHKLVWCCDIKVIALALSSGISVNGTAHCRVTRRIKHDSWLKRFGSWGSRAIPVIRLSWGSTIGLKYSKWLIAGQYKILSKSYLIVIKAYIINWKNTKAFIELRQRLDASPRDVIWNLRWTLLTMTYICMAYEYISI